MKEEHIIYEQRGYSLKVKKDEQFEGLMKLEYSCENEVSFIIYLTKDDAKKLIKVLEQIT